MAPGVASALIATGAPEEMTAYCRRLIETCAPTGNFILTNGCQIDNAKDENIRAMVDSVKRFNASPLP